LYSRLFLLWLSSLTTSQQGYCDKGQALSQVSQSGLFGKEVTVQTYGLDKYGRTLVMCSYPMVCTSTTRSSRKAGPGGIRSMRLRIRYLKGWSRKRERRRKDYGLIHILCHRGSGGRGAGELPNTYPRGLCIMCGTERKAPTATAQAAHTTQRLASALAVPLGVGGGSGDTITFCPGGQMVGAAVNPGPRKPQAVARAWQVNW
jgi:hypothetical protein